VVSFGLEESNMPDTPPIMTTKDAPLSLASVQTKVAAIAQQPGAEQAAEILRGEADVVRETFTKSGWRSSEFWLTLVVLVLGTIPVLVQVWQGKTTVEGSLPFLAAVGKAAAYTAGRSKVKAAEATATGVGP
jgi:hypothetical protein